MVKQKKVRPKPDLTDPVIVNKFWQKVDKSKGPNACWPWLGSRTKGGRGQFGPRGGKVYSPRVAYRLKRGKIPKGFLVLHDCDYPRCCNPSHLFLGTHQDNMKYRNNKGRQSKGETHGSAKLNRNKVRKARQLYAIGGWSIASLARLFFVSEPTMSRLLKRITWRHIL